MVAVSGLAGKGGTFSSCTVLFHALAEQLGNTPSISNCKVAVLSCSF